MAVGRWGDSVARLTLVSPGPLSLGRLQAWAWSGVLILCLQGATQNEELAVEILTESALGGMPAWDWRRHGEFTDCGQQKVGLGGCVPPPLLNSAAESQR
ncbi:hypothetical protein NDU88_000294 [Pleurodeles waltl]|uniref:Uncharacterized protein n=1 Tax=Pleurodeles waltl TaxID=8319 RepID=A0AAV7MP97_PLEWA|nr:hypothetical protein NDU88_000294 [Pleurodeles waltl]